MFKLDKGFTLIEALFAMVIVSIAMVGLVMTQNRFGVQSVDRTKINCLIDSAATAAIQCQTGITRTTSFTCDTGTAAVSVSGTCKEGLANNACNAVTVTASISGVSNFVLNTQVCNFP